MGRVVFFAYGVPSPIGNGGQHRGYQLLHDLKQVVGADNVEVFTHELYIKRIRSKTPFGYQLQRLFSGLQLRFGALIDNPLRIFSKANYTKRLMHGWFIIRDYEATLRQYGKPDVCVIEHSKYFPLMKINKKHRIPTLICPQNLDALNARLSLTKPLQRLTTMTDFSNEIQVLQAADERLFISKVETGVVGGLGIPSLYYPYRPVGQLAEHLARVGQIRRTTRQEAGLFLIIGSVYNQASMEGVQWFLDNATRHGLPTNARIVIIGQKTQRLQQAVESLPNAKILGFVEQAVLDEYLAKVAGVLILNKTGFGAITRLAEMQYAGIPAITFSHPTYAVDHSAGLIIADRWEEWITAMQNINELALTKASTIAWDDNPSILSKTIQRYL